MAVFVHGVAVLASRVALDSFRCYHQPAAHPTRAVVVHGGGDRERCWIGVLAVVCPTTRRFEAQPIRPAGNSIRVGVLSGQRWAGELTHGKCHPATGVCLTSNVTLGS